VHDGVVSGHDRSGVTGVGQVGLHVTDLLGPLVNRRGDVDRRHLVVGAEKTMNRRGADLPASTRDQYAHGVVSPRA